MNYSYRAIGPDGKTEVGEMEAPSTNAVVQDLKKQGLIVTDVSEVKLGLIALLNKPVEFGTKLPQAELVSFTRELATLLDAGLTLSKSLSVLLTMTRNKATLKVVENLLRDIREGESLASALKNQDGLFPKFYVSMASAGEASGQLAQVMGKLSHYLERSNQVREKIKSSLVYPIVLLVMVVLAMALIITVVLPQFEPIFSQVDGELPWVTTAVMGLSRIVNENGTLLLALCVIVPVASYLAYQRPGIKAKFHERYIRLPLVGDLIKKSEFARFHRMVGTLVENGLPLVSAYLLSMEGVSNIHISKGVEAIFENLKEGSNMSREYLKTDLAPTLAVELTRVGEDTGRLGAMLLKSADIMEEEVKNLVDKFMALLVPVITIFMGIIIAGMIASVLLGIMSVNEIAF